ncbi:MAG: DNA polymerase III subunit delta [Hyphomicrobiaceae bacterium]|nr:DNA polymerase III subunit delta [Hyphomicrobiaceae bacterium]
MVAVKAQNAARFVQRTPADCVAVLLYGSDDGMVSERAKQVASGFAGRDVGGGEIIRIEDVDLEGDPARLAVELQTQPMFGGGKVVRTTLGRRVTGAALKAIFDAGQPAAHLVVEGGNLKPTDAARKLFESTPWAAAVACFTDTDRDLAGLVGDMLGEAGLNIQPDAREMLISRLGADRALSRGEIEKLILYVSGRTTIMLDDVQAVVGDASEFVMDEIAISAASGRAAVALREFDRACAGGENPQTLLLAIQRHFLKLHRLRAAVDDGKTMDEAIRGMRPPIHFKQRDAFVGQCQAWPLARLSAVLQRVAATIRDTRRGAGLEAPMAERLLLDIAHAARQRSRR